MKRTNDYEKKPSQTASFTNPITLNLQTRPFAPIQSDDETEVSTVQAKYTQSRDLLKELISNPPPEKRTPIQRNPFPRLRNQANAIQAKLNIGEPNDKYEQEADRTAAQVVQQINSTSQEQSVQRSEEIEEEELQMKPISSIQRSGAIEEEELQMKPISSIQCSGAIEEEEELQMKSLVQRRENLSGGEASPDLESSIQSARGGGQPLDEGLQRSMGRAMGADFSGVKVHTDTNSDQLNKSIQAKAFTTGQDLFFRQGAYDPGSRGGQELIAHELTHVVQQNGGAVQRKLSSTQTFQGQQENVIQRQPKKEKAEQDKQRRNKQEQLKQSQQKSAMANKESTQLDGRNKRVEGANKKQEQQKKIDRELTDQARVVLADMNQQYTMWNGTITTRGAWWGSAAPGDRTGSRNVPHEVSKKLQGIVEGSWRFQDSREGGTSFHRTHPTSQIDFIYHMGA